jgi:hypothetical protein
MNSLNKDQDGKPLPIVETDILGLTKDKGKVTGSKAQPNRIFIVVAILLVLAVIYWFATK